MSDELLSEVRGHVACLTLNRPKAMNAINMALLDALKAELVSLDTNKDIRAVILTGNGSAFCAGADLKQVMATTDLGPGEPDLLDRAVEVLGRLRAFPRPVIVALNGVTMAGGLEIAMCADIVIAARSARIGDAHANYGVYPGAGGAAILPRLLPQNIANYLLLTGKTMSAAEMKVYGLVAEVHDDDALMDGAWALAALIAQKSPAALTRIKEVARGSADKSAADALSHEQVMLRKHMRSFDLAEGLAAFAEKRAPKFQGR